jgi:CubicO group peptidase (beta-lactamase class C family)
MPLKFPARRALSVAVLFAAIIALPASAADKAPKRTGPQIDAEVARAMAATHAKGLAIAVIEDGQVGYLKSYGVRNAKGDPLEPHTVMYAGSITKAAVGYAVMQLAQEGRIDLDASIAGYLAKPLPDYPDEDRYADFSVLKGDERWRKLTPRILLTHRSGFANFGFLEPDHKLRFHFEPGSRYAYSGDGMILLQFTLERGMGLDLGREMKTRVFDRLGMTRTSMDWRPDFAANLADGFDIDGDVHPHDERSVPRAAGSMDTTISDIARFAAGYVRGDGLSKAARTALTAPEFAITTASQFPTLQPELPAAQRRSDLSAGLGVITFSGPQGPGFYKGGHDDITGNTFVCLERGRRCVVILANDVRAEAAFPALVRYVLGETGAPWSWEYGDMKFWK